MRGAPNPLSRIVLLSVALLASLSESASAENIYWTDRVALKIQRSNLDGTGVTDLLTFSGPADPRGIGLDLAGGQMYWADASLGRIRRATLTGAGVTDLVTGLGAPSGLALDLTGGKLYWAEENGNRIVRANLDGTNVEPIVTTG